MNYRHIKVFNLKMLLLTIVAAMSCEVLDKDPIGDFSSELAFSSPERIELSAVGMYDVLQHEEFLGGRALIYADIRGEDTNVPSYFGDVARFNLLADNGTILNAWTGAYATINTANLFLEGMEANKDKITPEKAENYEGEALFIRALTHFYLVNLFAQPYNFTPDASHLGVPVRTFATSGENITDSQNEVPRSTVKQVYDQIIEDLKAAAEKLPASYGDSFSNVARATSGAAHALLSRVYLYTMNYPDAIAQADLVIAGDYDLNDHPLTAFTDFMTQESIFSVAHNQSDNPNTNHALGQHYGVTNRKDIFVDAFAEIPGLNADDLRLTEMTTEDEGHLYTLKFTDRADWAPILRYAEVLLNKAEALVKRDEEISQEAIDLLNEVRDRSQVSAASYEATDFASYEELLETILTERRIELAFEGHRLFDLLRNKKGVPAQPLDNVPAQAWGSDYVIFPIPQEEMLANPALAGQQNKGY